MITTLTRRPYDDPAEDAARLLLRLGVFLLFVASQLAPVLARHTIYILLPVGAALLLIGASLGGAPRHGRPLRAIVLSPAVLASAFLVFWAGLSLAWTPFAEGPAERFAKSSATLLLVALVCAALPARTKTSNLNLLPIGIGVAAASLIVVSMIALSAPAAADPFDVAPLGRVGVGLALLVWPAMGALAVRDRWPVAVALGLCAAIACYLSHAPHMLQALAAGLLAYGLASRRPRRVAPYLAGGFAAVVMTAPLVATAWRDLSPIPAALPALSAWGETVSRDGLRTLAGHGYGAAIYGLSGGYLNLASPRSFLFQLWFDLGALGAAAFSFVAARAFLIAGRMRPALAPFLLGGLATAMTACALGPGAEQLWWFTLAGLDAIAYALVVKGQFRKRRPRLPSNLSPTAPAAP